MRLHLTILVMCLMQVLTYQPKSLQEGAIPFYVLYRLMLSSHWPFQLLIIKKGILLSCFKAE